MKRIQLSAILLSVLLISGSGLLHAQTTLKYGLGKYFSVGCAVNSDIVRDTTCKAHQLVVNQFNSIVAENCMKPESLCPREGQWRWRQADQFVAFGERHGMRIIGHCLIWHSQTPEWFFRDAEGKDLSREALLERMHTYIATVVGRYKGRIAGWDVCNESFLDDGTLRDNRWHQIIGDDYMEWAYRFAHEADPDAELYYNDYSMSNPRKVTAACRLVQQLRAKGLRIDAVGMQSHNGLTWPRIADYGTAIDRLAAAGVKVIISELDLNVLPNPKGFSGAEVDQHFEYTPEMDPYANGMDDHTRDVIFERWQAFFLLYKQHAHQIDRVTFWAVGDKDSWMANWPIEGRHTYATLFDQNYDPKPVVEDIIKMYQLPKTNDK